MPRRNQWEAPAEQPGGPGASGPGQSGYDGDVTVGDDAGGTGFDNPEGWSAEDLALLGREDADADTPDEARRTG